MNLVKQVLPCLNIDEKIREGFVTLIPELKESEDERIRKELIFFLKEEIQQCSIKEHAEKLKEFVSYVEQQEHDGKKWIYEDDYHKDMYRNFSDGMDEVLEHPEKYGLQKEQKTVEIDEIIRKARSEGRQEVIDNPEYYQLIKPEWKPECDNETEVQKAYREGKNAGRKEVFDHPEYYGLQLRRKYDYETGERNPGWGEEDEKTINELCDIIASNAKNGYLGGYYAPDLIEKLKSIHHQPKQEWSKEDENKIERLAFLVSIAAEKEMISEEECIDLRQFVMSYRPQTKQEWSEEDEKVRKWLLEYFYLHKDDLRGASVTSMEVLSFLENHPENGKACDVDEFNPQPGEKFWVRCKTDKAENLWFDKGDERPAYGVTDADGFMTYIVHIKKDGTGNCVSYHDKKKFLETFDIVDEKTVEQWPKLSNCKHDCRTCFAKCLYRKERNPEQ